MDGISLLLWIRDGVSAESVCLRASKPADRRLPQNASCPLCRTLFIERPSRNESQRQRQRQRQRRAPAAYGGVAVDSGDISRMYS
jgi:hypothetical protein